MISAQGVLSRVRDLMADAQAGLSEDDYREVCRQVSAIVAADVEDDGEFYIDDEGELGIEGWDDE